MHLNIISYHKEVFLTVPNQPNKTALSRTLDSGSRLAIRVPVRPEKKNLLHLQTGVRSALTLGKGCETDITLSNHYTELSNSSSFTL